MKHCNTAMWALLLGLFIFQDMARTEEVLHHDLLPMYSPDDPAFLRDLARRFEDVKNISKLKHLNKTQELCIYIFYQHLTIRISVFTESTRSMHPAHVAHWIEFCKYSESTENDSGIYVAAFQIPDSFELQYSLSWRNLLFRTNTGYFDARILTDSPWMMVTGWGLQGRLQYPYRDSPVGRLLSETLMLVNSGCNGKIDPDTWKSYEQNVAGIRQLVESGDGAWKFEVADPYERNRDDADIPRFNFDEFLEIGRE